jgi:hypothetical protein
MPNPIKYTAGTETLALKKGNFYIGTGDVGKGPSDTTGYYQGPNVPSGGYVIYLNKEGAPGGLSYHSAANDAQLIAFTNNLAGQSYTTVNECLVYYAGQSDKVVLNRDYEGIVTDGLILNVDAGFTPSYPRSGTTWSDVSLSGNNGTLINGPTFSGDSIVFDGVDDYVTTTNFYLSTSPASILIWFKAGTQTDNTMSILRPIMQQGYFDGNFPAITQGIEINMVRTGNDAVGKLRFAWGGDNNTDYQYLTTDRYDNNQWTFVCNINNGSTFDVYINGVNLATKITHTSVSTSTPVNFGGDTFIGARKLVGNIAIAQIYNRALTATEVLQNYNAQKGRFGL